MRDMVQCAKNNPGLKLLGYEHRAVFCDEGWYEQELKRIAERRHDLDEHRKDTSLQEVRIAYWPSNGSGQIKVIWHRQS